MKAPTPTTEPATAFIVAAAPVDSGEPDPVCEPAEPEAPEPVAPVPVASEPEAPELVGLERMMVVELLALTTRV
jgi:hypothetical protein